jgi:regulator of protease activity HflC (stomatin/prohibitin superfamily)
MRYALTLTAVAAASVVFITGCTTAALIQPGHRGILFDPMNGLKHEVLPPGYYHLANGCKALKCPRVDDFDVTYSTSKEDIQTNSAEQLVLDMRLAIIYRPIISELYELDTEVGPNYYDEVVGPEFRSATRGVLARHSYTELLIHNKDIEDEIEREVRDRIKGKHVEIASITMEKINYAPEIAAAVRSKIVGEQEAARQKAFLENEALKNKLQLEHAAEHARLKAETDAAQTKLANEAELQAKEHEHEMAKVQAAIDKVAADGDAVSRITRAKTQSEEMRLLAKGQADKNRAEGLSITPLMVQMHAYDALGQLGGKGTTILLGEWSHVPSFLFPRLGSLPMPYAPSSYSGDAPPAPPSVTPTGAKAAVEDDYRLPILEKSKQKAPSRSKVEEKNAKSSPGF